MPKQVTEAEIIANAAERRVTIAEERVTTMCKVVSAEEKRANVAEARAATAETRVSVAEDRAKKAEIDTKAAYTKVTILEERIWNAEDTVKSLHERLLISDNRIAELVQANNYLREMATTAEQQVRDVSMQCRILQKQLEISWTVKVEEIKLTDTELGRGGCGVVKVARFCGLEVAAKLLHGAILSLHNQQLFEREMNMLELSSCQFPELQRRQELIKQLSWSAMKAMIENCTARDPRYRPNIADILIRLHTI